MATLSNRRKLAHLNRENCHKNPRSNLAQTSNVPRSQEEYINQVSEKIEGRITKKLSQEFSKNKNCNLGSLFRLDDFLMNPLIQGHSGTAPETSRITYGTEKGTNEADCQSDLHPESSLLQSQTTWHSGPEGGHDSTRHDGADHWHFSDFSSNSK